MIFKTEDAWQHFKQFCQTPKQTEQQHESTQEVVYDFNHVAYSLSEAQMVWPAAMFERRERIDPDDVKALCYHYFHAMREISDRITVINHHASGDPDYHEHLVNVSRYGVYSFVWAAEAREFRVYRRYEEDGAIWHERVMA
jgi:hypothetical protein